MTYGATYLEALILVVLLLHLQILVIIFVHLTDIQLWNIQVLINLKFQFMNWDQCGRFLKNFFILFLNLSFSLGAVNDGSGSAKSCSVSLNNIMIPLIGGSNKFSQCSISSFKSRLLSPNMT